MVCYLDPPERLLHLNTRHNTDILQSSQAQALQPEEGAVDRRGTKNAVFPPNAPPQPNRRSPPYSFRVHSRKVRTNLQQR